MFDQGHNRLPVLIHELEVAMGDVVAKDGTFYEMRHQARAIAEAYPEFIVWAPELHRAEGEAVSDIWDRSWNRLAVAQVTASERMVDAPMW